MEQILDHTKYIETNIFGMEYRITVYARIKYTHCWGDYYTPDTHDSEIIYLEIISASYYDEDLDAEIESEKTDQELLMELDLTAQDFDFDL
jgi:hypothetical protein